MEHTRTIYVKYKIGLIYLISSGFFFIIFFFQDMFILYFFVFDKKVRYTKKYHNTPKQIWDFRNTKIF